MPPTRQELSLLISPVVPDAVAHNKRVSTLPLSLSLGLFLGISRLLSYPSPPSSMPPKLTIWYKNLRFQTLSALHSLAAFLLGVSAGILGLQSSHGFAFYLLGTLFVSLLFHAALIGFGGSSSTSSGSAARAGGKDVAGADAYFPGTGEIVDGGRKGAWRDVWFAGGVVGEGLSGFVLGWAGVGGFLR